MLLNELCACECIISLDLGSVVAITKKSRDKTKTRTKSIRRLYTLLQVLPTCHVSHVELCHVSVSRLPGSCTCVAWWTGRWADLLAASHRQDHHRDDDEVQHGEGNHLQHLPGDIHSITYNIHGCYHSFTSEYWYRYNVVLRCYLKEAYKMLLLDRDQANRNNFYFKAKLVRPETERGQVSEASHHTHTHLFNFPLSPYRVLLKIKWFSFSWLQAWWFWLSLFCLHTVTCDLTI